ncbi:hypothetical protein V8B55DRAFT_1150084 [Mucor lusitanicus]|uniref:Uncharacterized protein n=1 Tax=Mucor circinelloides f. lusitanicus TaxID=29924 RepID=A0A8H4BCB6_MUCCL|nr:hypothetical protein FB192DRAFT_1133993 [Mucor lusitanicus]
MGQCHLVQFSGLICYFTVLLNSICTSLPLESNGQRPTVVLLMDPPAMISVLFYQTATDAHIRQQRCQHDCCTEPSFVVYTYVTFFCLLFISPYSSDFPFFFFLFL